MQAQDAPKSTTVKGGVDLEKVHGALAPVFAAHGVELVELDFLTDQGGWTLRVTIERRGAGPTSADGSFGVTLADCVEVSRDSSAVLDVEDLIPHHYNLEVSSPGLDRKLRGAADFVRFTGQLVKAKLSKPAPDGQRVLRGRLEEASEERVAVNVDGKRIEVPIEHVEEARLVFELQPVPKKGKVKRPQKAGKNRSKGAGADNQNRGGPQQ
jgi:ribosome maturation factor RimP